MSHDSVSERIPAAIEDENGRTSGHSAIMAGKGRKASDSAYSESPQVISTQGSPGKQKKYNKYHAVLH